jgi:methyl-accepting chemotaxis protein/methyl-accepting chemotaxis protein-1 (serine sensor receptor)
MAQWERLDRSLTGMLAANQAVEAHVKSDKDGRPIREALRKDFEVLIASQRATLKADSALAQSVFMRSLLILVVILGVAAAVAVLTVVTVRRINRDLGSGLAEISTGAKQVVAASTQVSSSAQSLSEGATEQAASLEETSASMEEMASMTRRNAENSQDAAAQMAETERLVSGANRALGELVTSMTQIRESSGQVTKIIKTIDEIAFQTNILALNAAVEAARAGEAGMGFAVVADEVRNLAQRSAQAAKDTAALIEASASNATAGGEKVDAVVTAMTAITTSSGRVRGLVEEVSLASRQQSQGIDQVTQAITQMEKVTQTTAATAEESAAASEDLNAQAEQTLSTGRRVELMVRRDVEAEVVRSRKAPNVVSMKRPARPSPMTPADHTDLRPTGTYDSF